jgi:hypothetical protein
VDVCNLADIYNRAPTIMGHVACFFILFYSVVTTFKLFVCLLLLNATFNNILVISWRSVFLVEEAGVLGENYRSVASHSQTLSQNVVHIALIEIPIHNISGDRH